MHGLDFSCICRGALPSLLMVPFQNDDSFVRWQPYNWLNFLMLQVWRCWHLCCDVLGDHEDPGPCYNPVLLPDVSFQFGVSCSDAQPGKGVGGWVGGLRVIPLNDAWLNATAYIKVSALEWLGRNFLFQFTFHTWRKADISFGNSTLSPFMFYYNASFRRTKFGALFLFHS